MKLSKTENYSKCFVWFSKAWHSKHQKLRQDDVDELSIELRNSDGILVGSFLIIWGELSGSVVPRLKAFDDSWDALFNMPELLEYMSSIDDCNVPINEFVDALLKLGFIDETPVTRKV